MKNSSIIRVRLAVQSCRKVFILSDIIRSIIKSTGPDKIHLCVLRELVD